MRTPNCTAWYGGPCEIPSPFCPASITLIPLPLTLAYNPSPTDPGCASRGAALAVPSGFRGGAPQVVTGQESATAQLTLLRR